MPIPSKWLDSDRSAWRQFIAALAKSLPIGRYSVRRVAMARDFGSVVRDRGVWNIRVARRLDLGAAVYALLEEWAHAMSWSHSGPEHTDRWGTNYARCVRVSESVDASL